MATEVKEVFRHTPTRNAQCTAQTNYFNMVFRLPAKQSTRWLLLSLILIYKESACVLTLFCQANYKWMKFPFAVTYLMLPQRSFGTAAMKPVLPDSCSHQCHSWVNSNCCPREPPSPEVSSRPACWPAVRGPGNGISTSSDLQHLQISE